MAALDHCCPNFPACLFYERSVDQRQSVHKLVTREERDNAFAVTHFGCLQRAAPYEIAKDYDRLAKLAEENRAFHNRGASEEE
jgi:hypothetical protein